MSRDRASWTSSGSGNSRAIDDPGGVAGPPGMMGGSAPVDRQRAARWRTTTRLSSRSGWPCTRATRANGRLAGLASAYADACAEAAQRLGRCHRLLQQGLRTEAIQLAESEPKLLDSLAVLDFPERPEWDDLVQMRDLTAAPRIPLEPARLLNEAYAEEDPLQELLRRHRRLALQRAPLRLRIAVLRQLAAQDPGIPIWADDLRAFEQVRMLEIQDEATEALRHHDPEWIGAAAGRGRAIRLDRRRRRSRWSSRSARSTRRSRGTAPARRWRTSRPGSTRRSTRATRSAVGWRASEWTAWPRTAALSHDDPIADRARPALDWLDDQDRRDRENREHAEAIAGLVRALDYPGTLAPDELERLAHAVQAHGDGFPEGLRQRYITRLRDAEAAQTRRKRRIAAGSAAGVAPRRHADLPGRPRPGPLPRGRAGRRRHRRPARARRGRPGHRPGQEARGGRPRPVQVPGAGRGPPAGRAGAEQGVGPGLAVRPGDARGPGGPRLGQAAAGAWRRPARWPGSIPRRRSSTTWSAAAPPRSRRRRAVARRRSRRASTRSPARSIGSRPSSTPTARADRTTRRCWARSPIPSGRSRNSRPTSRPPATARRTVRATSPIGSKPSGRGWSGAASRAALEDAITAAVSYSPDGRGFKGSAELASALQAFARRSPTRPARMPSPTTLRDQPVWDAIGEWDRPDGRLAGRPTAVAPQEANVRAEQCRQFLVQHPASPDVRARDGLPAGHGGRLASLGRRRGRARQAPEADDRPPGQQPLDGHRAAPGLRRPAALLRDRAARAQRQVAPLPRRLRRQGADPHRGRATGSRRSTCRRRRRSPRSSSRCSSRTRPRSTGRSRCST